MKNNPLKPVIISLIDQIVDIAVEECSKTLEQTIANYNIAMAIKQDDYEQSLVVWRVTAITLSVVTVVTVAVVLLRR